MHTYHIRVDITGAVDLGGPLETAVSVHLPDELDGKVMVILGYPGGGYARGYYDIKLLPGYSQAEYHTAQGAVFVACDHLGIGDSSPVNPIDLTLERMAAANHATASAVVDRLAAGKLADGVPPLVISRVVGVGQSMGGCLLIVQQGIHATFDAIGILGYGIRSSFPMPDGTRVTFPAPPRGADPRQTADALTAVAEHGDLIRYAFHHADEEPELVAADMGSSPQVDSGLAPWRAGDGVPPCAASMMGEGAVAPEAAALEVPVLIGCGALDLVTEPRSEPGWYRSSPDIAVVVVPRMAHMHNFARTRQALWKRVALLAETPPLPAN